MVRLDDVLRSIPYSSMRKPLKVALGHDVAGNARVADLAKMPHLLIAGTTGSGKSIFMKSLITSLIANNSPDDLKIILIDPKRVEMTRFNGLPHLIGKAEVEPDRILGVLQWIVGEMQHRYTEFERIGARQIDQYNSRAELEDKPSFSRLVVFIDELADLMVQRGNEVEQLLCRLAQMARATGIHLIVATQRPSTNIITGLIKANFPARVGLSVTSSIDSRVILDTTGAEQLLGNGDMLYLGSDASTPVRIQSCFVSDEEIDRIVQYWNNEYPMPENSQAPWESLLDRIAVLSDKDDILENAITLCQKYDNISSSLLQRRLKIGYPRAAQLMKDLYEMGLVEDPKKGGKTRKTYVSEADKDPLGQYIEKNRDTLFHEDDEEEFDDLF